MKSKDDKLKKKVEFVVGSMVYLKRKVYLSQPSQVHDKLWESSSSNRQINKARIIGGIFMVITTSDIMKILIGYKGLRHAYIFFPEAIWNHFDYSHFTDEV